VSRLAGHSQHAVVPLPFVIPVLERPQGFGAARTCAKSIAGLLADQARAWRNVHSVRRCFRKHAAITCRSLPGWNCGNRSKDGTAGPIERRTVRMLDHRLA
jgi:hypothetical protein